MLSLRRYEPVAAFLNVLKSGRCTDAGVDVYDSVTVKRIFDDLNDISLIDRFVHEIEQPGNMQMKFVREILIAIQSVDVALRLASIITHPQRSVRQHCLKVLSELGTPAVTIFSDVLQDESNFLRPEGRHELPDEQWFFVRNAIFVLGNLSDERACAALRLRLSDPDVRIRSELVKALEKIDGDEAIDLLMIMAEDIDHSIREAAVISLGLLRRHDLLPFFKNIMSRQKAEIQRIITAIAQTGTQDGRDFLAGLLENRDRLKSFSSAHGSIGDIRKWILKVLEKAGDDVTIEKKEDLKEKHDGKSVFSRDLKLGKTAKSFLNKIQPKK
jgi:HEAT repeat protein